jgi:hypothetical protein
MVGTTDIDFKVTSSERYGLNNVIKFDILMNFKVWTTSVPNFSVM